MTNPYARHADFVAPARDGTAFWLIPVGLVLSDFAFALSPLILFPLFGDGTYDVLEGRTPISLALSLSLYAIPALAIVQWVRLRHRRSGWSLIGPPLTALKDARRVGWAVLLALLAIELLPPFADLSLLEDTRPLPLWVLSLPLALVAVLIQSGSEEIIFRGYLQQQLAALDDRPVVWMLIPSILFGGLHYWNATGAAEGVLWAFWAVLLGLACADLTARTGTLGAAIGLHTANNLAILALFGPAGGPDSGFALFLYPYEEPGRGPGLDALASPWALLDVILSLGFILVLWLAARVALRR